MPSMTELQCHLKLSSTVWHDPATNVSWLKHKLVTPERVSKQRRMLTRVSLLRKYLQVGEGID